MNAALAQTYANIQIVVCDNASSDDTESFVRSIRDARIKYIRNETNIGAARNFALAVDVADGTFFSWLQDDDLVARHFVERAVNVLQQFNATIYVGSALNSVSQFCADGSAYRPPVALDWLNSAPEVVSSTAILGVSFFASFGIPPVIAFESKVLREEVATLRRSNFPLFAERTILCEAAINGLVVADPQIVGLFRRHDQQSSVVWVKEKNRYQTEWKRLCEYLDALMPADFFTRCEELEDIISNVPDVTLTEWLRAAARFDGRLRNLCELRVLLQRTAAKRSLRCACYGNAAFVVSKVAEKLAPPVVLPLVRRCISLFSSRPRFR